MSGPVEYASLGVSQAQRDGYALSRLLEASADGTTLSLAEFLGTDVVTAMAIRDSGRLGEAIEARRAEKAAEARSQCGCGCQDRAMSPLEADAIIRRKLVSSR